MGILVAFPVSDVFFLLVLYAGYLWTEIKSAPIQTQILIRTKLFFILMWALFLSNFRWRGSGDVVATSLQPFELMRYGHLYMDEFYRGFLDNQDISWVYFRNRHALSMYSSAAGILLTPFYVIPVLFHVPVTDLLIHQYQKIGASFMVVVSAYFFFKVVESQSGKKWAYLLTVAYAFGTSSLSTSSQAIWQHGPGQLFLSLGSYFLFRWEDNPSERRLGFWSGFCFAMAAWCRYSNILIWGLVGAFVGVKKKSGLKYYLSGTLFPALAIAADNFFHSGSVMKTGYQASTLHFTPHLWDGFWGLLVSPARGLLLFSPLAIFACWGFFEAWRTRDNDLVRLFSIGVSATIVFYSGYFVWSGGWAFGPRYLADITPLWMLGLLPIMPRIAKSTVLKRLFLFAFGFSILVHAIGAYFTWSWEKLYTLSLWNWQRNPVVYLLTQAVTPGSRDRIEGIAVSFIIAGLLIACSRVQKVPA